MTYCQPQPQPQPQPLTVNLTLTVNLNPYCHLVQKLKIHFLDKWEAVDAF